MELRRDRELENIKDLHVRDDFVSEVSELFLATTEIEEQGKERGLEMRKNLPVQNGYCLTGFRVQTQIIRELGSLASPLPTPLNVLPKNWKIIQTKESSP